MTPTDGRLVPLSDVKQLADAAGAAFHLCESLLAVREGPTNALIEEVRDALANAYIRTGLQLVGIQPLGARE